MQYEEVDDRIKQMKGKSLADLMGESIAGDWMRGISETMLAKT